MRSGILAILAALSLSGCQSAAPTAAPVDLSKPIPPARAKDGWNVAADVRHSCSAEWPGDYRMQEYCIKQQNEAAAYMRPIISSAVGVEQQIVRKCASEWSTPSGFNYRMVKYCYEQQMGAYRRLN